MKSTKAAEFIENKRKERYRGRLHLTDVCCAVELAEAELEAESENPYRLMWGEYKNEVQQMADFTSDTYNLSQMIELEKKYLKTE